MDLMEIKKKVLELTNFYGFKTGKLKEDFKKIADAIFKNDLYKAVHLLSDTIKFTEFEGMYVSKQLSETNTKLKELSYLVSKEFERMMAY